MRAEDILAARNEGGKKVKKIIMKDMFYSFMVLLLEEINNTDKPLGSLESMYKAMGVPIEINNNIENNYEVIYYDD